MNLSTKIQLVDLAGIKIKSVKVPAGFVDGMASDVGYEAFNDGKKVGTYVRLNNAVRMVYPRGQQYNTTTHYGNPLDSFNQDLYQYVVHQMAKLAADKFQSNLRD